jgi:hypothetical protein
MNRYILIRRLRGPSFLLLIGVRCTAEPRLTNTSGACSGRLLFILPASSCCCRARGTGHPMVRSAHPYPGSLTRRALSGAADPAALHRPQRSRQPSFPPIPRLWDGPTEDNHEQRTSQHASRRRRSRPPIRLTIRRPSGASTASSRRPHGARSAMPGRPSATPPRPATYGGVTVRAFLPSSAPSSWSASASSPCSSSPATSPRRFLDWYGTGGRCCSSAPAWPCSASGRSTCAARCRPPRRQLRRHPHPAGHRRPLRRRLEQLVGSVRAQFGDKGDDFFNILRPARARQRPAGAERADSRQRRHRDSESARRHQHHRRRRPNVEVQAHEVAYANSDSDAKKDLRLRGRPPDRQRQRRAGQVGQQQQRPAQPHRHRSQVRARHVNAGKGDVTAAGLGAGINVTAPRRRAPERHHRLGPGALLQRTSTTSPRTRSMATHHRRRLQRPHPL